MSTKAQLEAEIAKMTEERVGFLRQIKNLKKRKNARPVAAATDNKLSVEKEKDLLEQITALDKENAIFVKTIAIKDQDIDSYVRKHTAITKFAELSWFQRLTWSKEDIKKLL